MDAKTSQHSSQRNYGIDALRLFSMFLAVVLHILGGGGLLRAVSGTKYTISWLFEISAFCAVNCFGIISGYTSYSSESKHRPFRKYIALWIQVAFYSLGIVLLVNRIDPRSVSYDDIFKAFRPVSTECYWYFSAYTALYFVMPWLDLLMRACTRQQADQLIRVLVLLFSFCPIILGNEALFGLSSGYSFLWLALLYLIGAWMKKYDIPGRIRSTSALSASVLCILITWILKVCFQVHALISYLSPTILLESAALFVFFSRMKVTGVFKKLIVCFSPAAFGVYLIHVHPFAWRILVENRYPFLAQTSTILFPFAFLFRAFSLFTFCLLIEKIRLIVFRILRVHSLLGILCDQCNAIMHRLCK